MKFLLSIFLFFLIQPTTGMNFGYFMHLENLKYSLPLKIKNYQEALKNQKSNQKNQIEKKIN